MALNLNLCYLSVNDCTEVFAYSQQVATTTTAPTLAQVEAFVYDTSAIIETQTQIAGALTSPPYSGITPARLSRMLLSANAIGAAYYQRHAMYTLNQDDKSLRDMERLAGLWQTYMGQGSLSVGAGTASLTVGAGGLIAQTIASASGSRLLVSAVSAGEVTLADLEERVQSIPYTTLDRD